MEYRILISIVDISADLTNSNNELSKNIDGDNILFTNIDIDKEILLTRGILQTLVSISIRIWHIEQR